MLKVKIMLDSYQLNSTKNLMGNNDGESSNDILPYSFFFALTGTLAVFAFSDALGAIFAESMS